MILVTGASGFIGKSLLKKLKFKKNEIILILRKKSKTYERSGYKTFYSSNIFNKDVKWWIKKLKNVHTVIHLAWDMKKKNYLNDDYNIIQIIGSINLSIACAKTSVKNFISIGTCLEYEDTQKKTSINSKINPDTLYGASKAALFFIFKNFFKNKKINFLWCRLYFLYGDFENPRRLYPKILEAINKKKNIRISNPKNIIDISNIEKITDKLSYYINSKEMTIKNLCSGKGISVKDFILKVIKKNKSQIKVITKKSFNKNKYIVGINK